MNPIVLSTAAIKLLAERSEAAPDGVTKLPLDAGGDGDRFVRGGSKKTLPSIPRSEPRHLQELKNAASRALAKLRAEKARGSTIGGLEETNLKALARLADTLAAPHDDPAGLGELIRAHEALGALINKRGLGAEATAIAKRVFEQLGPEVQDARSQLAAALEDVRDEGRLDAARKLAELEQTIDAANQLSFGADAGGRLETAGLLNIVESGRYGHLNEADRARIETTLAELAEKRAQLEAFLTSATEEFSALSAKVLAENGPLAEDELRRFFELSMLLGPPARPLVHARDALEATERGLARAFADGETRKALAPELANILACSPDQVPAELSDAALAQPIREAARGLGLDLDAPPYAQLTPGEKLAVLAAHRLRAVEQDLQRAAAAADAELLRSVLLIPVELDRDPPAELEKLVRRELFLPEEGEVKPEVFQKKLIERLESAHSIRAGDLDDLTRYLETRAKPLQLSEVISKLNDRKISPSTRRILSMLVTRDPSGQLSASPLFATIAPEGRADAEKTRDLARLLDEVPGKMIPRAAFGADTLAALEHLRSESFAEVRAALSGPADRPLAQLDRRVLAALYQARFGEDLEDDLGARFSGAQRAELLKLLVRESAVDRAAQLRDRLRSPEEMALVAEQYLDEGARGPSKQYAGGMVIHDRDRLEAAVAEWNKTFPNERLNITQLSLDDVESLRSLGYYQPDPDVEGRFLAEGRRLADEARAAARALKSALAAKDPAATRRAWEKLSLADSELRDSMSIYDAAKNGAITEKIDDLQDYLAITRAVRDVSAATFTLVATAGLATPVAAGAWALRARALAGGIGAGLSFQTALAVAGEGSQRVFGDGKFDLGRAAEEVAKQAPGTAFTAASTAFPMLMFGRLGQLAKEGSKVSSALMNTVAGRFLLNGTVNTGIDFAGHQMSLAMLPEGATIPEYTKGRALAMFGLGGVFGNLGSKTQSIWADRALDFGSAAIQLGVANTFDGRGFGEGMWEQLPSILALRIANRTHGKAPPLTKLKNTVEKTWPLFDVVPAFPGDFPLGKIRPKISKPVFEKNVDFLSRPGGAAVHRITIGEKTIQVYAAKNSDPAAGVNPTVEELAAALASMPAESRALIDEIWIEPGRHQREAFLTQGLSGEFRADMTVDVLKKRVHVWPLAEKRTRESMAGALTHEAGHVLSLRGWNLDHDYGPEWAAWQKAIDSDGHVPSRYARKDRAEDFAETYRLYHKVKGTPKEAEARAFFRKRFEILDGSRPAIAKKSAETKQVIMKHVPAAHDLRSAAQAMKAKIDETLKAYAAGDLTVQEAIKTLGPNGPAAQLAREHGYDVETTRVQYRVDGGELSEKLVHLAHGSGVSGGDLDPTGVVKLPELEWAYKPEAGAKELKLLPPKLRDKLCLAVKDRAKIAAFETTREGQLALENILMLRAEELYHVTQRFQGISSGDANLSNYARQRGSGKGRFGPEGDVMARIMEMVPSLSTENVKAMVSRYAFTSERAEVAAAFAKSTQRRDTVAGSLHQLDAYLKKHEPNGGEITDFLNGEVKIKYQGETKLIDAGGARNALMELIAGTRSVASPEFGPVIGKKVAAVMEKAARAAGVELTVVDMTAHEMGYLVAVEKSVLDTIARHPKVFDDFDAGKYSREKGKYLAKYLTEANAGSVSWKADAKSNRQMGRLYGFPEQGTERWIKYLQQHHGETAAKWQKLRKSEPQRPLAESEQKFQAEAWFGAAMVKNSSALGAAVKSAEQRGELLQSSSPYASSGFRYGPEDQASVDALRALEREVIASALEKRFPRAYETGRAFDTELVSLEALGALQLEGEVR